MPEIDEPFPCQRQIERASRTDPPEFCPNEAVPGEDYCDFHLAYPR